MAAYRFTSKLFQGVIFFEYADGVLVTFEKKAQLTQEQHNYFAKNFPFFEENLAVFAGKSGKIEHVEQDLSFDAFWNYYGQKINKLRTEPIWQKLTKADRAAVFAAIPKYKYHCKIKGIAMANPENYLRDRRFEDEY